MTDIKDNAQQSAAQQPKAAAAPRPAARPAAPAAPAAPAKNQLDAKVVAPADLRKEMERLRAEEHMDFLENLTGLDWEEEGLGVIYQLESTETG